jgi:hypothetical protein
MMDGKKTYLALLLALVAKIAMIWQGGDPGISDAEAVEFIEWASAAGVLAALRDALRKLERPTAPRPSGRELGR